MIDINKIKSRIDKFGPTKLEILVNWFPQCSKSDLEEVISNSTGLQIKDDIVCIENTPTDLEDITYKQLLEIISKYNEKTKKNFEEKYNLQDLKIQAIRKFLEDKFILEEFNIKELYSSYIGTNKRNDNKCYIVVCKVFNEEVFKDLNTEFSGKEVQIYYIDVTTSTSTVEDYYFKDSNEIINQMLKKYELVEETVNLYRITEE